MFAKGYNNVVSKEVILELTSEEAILNHYLGIKSLPMTINAPYRVDKAPSLHICYNENCITWFDYGRNEGGDIFSLLMRIYNLNFQKVLEKIYNDMKLFDSFSGNKVKINYIKKKGSTTFSVEVKVRDIQKHDIEYWKSYGVTDFTSWNIYPISMFKYTNNFTGHSNVIRADKYSYAFYEYQNGKHSIKIYQPYNTTGYKWFSGHDSNVMDLLNYLPKTGNNLILASSRKDAVNIWSNSGIPSISPQGEGYTLSKHLIDSLKSRFVNLHVFYDNDFDKEDNPGQKDSQKICSSYGLNNIIIPSETGSKDPSDLYKNNKKLYKEVMHNILPTNTLKNFLI